jgi:hypothetical protein
MTIVRTLVLVALLGGAVGCATQGARADRIQDPQTCEGLMGQQKVDCENTFGGVVK